MKRHTTGLTGGIARLARPKAAQRAGGERRAGRRIHFAANRPWLAAPTLMIVGALLAGCNNIEIALLPQHVILPEVEASPGGGQSCLFDAAGEPAAAVGINVSLQPTLFLAVALRNNLQAQEIVLQGSPAESIQIPSQVAPLRFDYRWECDSNGFTAGQGPLVLPAFSVNPDTPFCLDTRDETTRDFIGFDVISASGGYIEPGGIGVAEIRPITPQLGDAFRDLFSMAERAAACCESVNGCENLPTDANVMSGPCAELQQLFDSVAGAGVLDVRNVDDVRRWEPFVTYTNSPLGGRSVPYKLRMRGVFEGITAGGQLVSSTELVQDVGIVSCTGDPLTWAFGCYTLPCSAL